MPYKDPEINRRWQREWRAQRRAEYLADKACVRCGSTENLEIDHRDPAKKVSHRIWSWSLKRRTEELAKCQVLCGRCHRIKTARQRREQIQHGTESGYHRLKCRCPSCRRAHQNGCTAQRRLALV